jgi:hypothetical protein
MLATTQAKTARRDARRIAPRQDASTANQALLEIQRLQDVEDRLVGVENKISAIEAQIPEAFRGEPRIMIEDYDRYTGKVGNRLCLTLATVNRALLADPRACSPGVRRIHETLRTELNYREEAKKRERTRLGLDPLDAESAQLNNAVVEQTKTLRAWSPANAAEATALLEWALADTDAVGDGMRSRRFEFHEEQYRLMQRCVACLSRQLLVP